MKIKVTAKAKNLLKPATGETQEIAPAHPLFSWEVTSFSHHHQPALVFANNATTLTVILYQVASQTIDQLRERFEANLKTLWTQLNLPAAGLTEYLQRGGAWQVQSAPRRAKREITEDLLSQSVDLSEEELGILLTNQEWGQGELAVDRELTVNIFRQAIASHFAGTDLLVTDSALPILIEELNAFSQLNGELLSASEYEQKVIQLQKLNDRLLQLFLMALAEKFSAQTVRRYEKDLNAYLNHWLAPRLLTVLDQESTKVSRLIANGTPSSEVKHLQTSLKKLWQYLNQQGIFEDQHLAEFAKALAHEDLTAPVNVEGKDDDIAFSDLADDAEETIPVVFDKETDQLVEDYLAAFASLYGLIPAHQAFQIINAQNSRITKGKFYRYLDMHRGILFPLYQVLDLNQAVQEMQVDAVFEEGLFIVHPAFLVDLVRLADLYEHQLGLQYFVPDAEELLRYRYEDYFDIRQLPEQLHELFDHKYGLNSFHAHTAVAMCLFGMKMGTYQNDDKEGMMVQASRVLAMLNNSFDLGIDDDDDPQLITLLIAVGKEIRRPWNRGWSSRQQAKIPNIGQLIFQAGYELPAELVAAIDQGKVDRRELIYVIEESDLSLKQIRELRSQLEDM